MAVRSFVFDTEKACPLAPWTDSASLLFDIDGHLRRYRLHLIADIQGGVRHHRKREEIFDLVPQITSSFRSLIKRSVFFTHQINYIGIVVLDGGILILAAFLNPRAKRRRAAAQAADAEKGAINSPTTDSAIDNSTAETGAATRELEHHRDVGAISGTGRDGEPDLGMVDKAMGKNREEERAEAARPGKERVTPGVEGKRQ
jgi:hypothetical protein